ncbi:hypothetical protein RRG08_033708 [Elysia crispata]|uniref:Uncharacterized protein n=1 Tax=Elysia crispata TaxID=231223 RepID=A0AAE1DUD8_9GAST|nr:hypothetical protein RRG08_033708 [Elysia crispata]
MSRKSNSSSATFARYPRQSPEISAIPERSQQRGPNSHPSITQPESFYSESFYWARQAVSVRVLRLKSLATPGDIQTYTSR